MCRLKVNEERKYTMLTLTKKKVEQLALLIPDRTDFRARNVIRDKEGHYIMINGSILQENITLSVYAPNNRASKLMKQKLIDGKEEQMNSLSELEVSAPLYQKWRDPEDRKSVRTLQDK